MPAIVERLRRMSKQTAERGASAVEYGLMVAAIAAVIVGTVFALGGFVSAAFTKTCETIAGAPGNLANTTGTGTTADACAPATTN